MSFNERPGIAVCRPVITCGKMQKNQIIKELKEWNRKTNWGEKLLFSEHHLSHAASAYFPSPFQSAAVSTRAASAHRTLIYAFDAKRPKAPLSAMPAQMREWMLLCLLGPVSA